MTEPTPTELKLYELALILASHLDEAAQEAKMAKVQEVLDASGGQVEQVDKWGRRGLAYEIKGRRDGIYLFVRFRSPSPALRELDRVLKLDDGVLRHMIVVAEEAPEAVEATPA
jgi:small subunit ribosomal protein S6